MKEDKVPILFLWGELDFLESNFGSGPNRQSLTFLADGGNQNNGGCIAKGENNLASSN